jgi:hypothetical protein
LAGTHLRRPASHTSPGPQLPAVLNGVLALPFMSLRKPLSLDACDSAELFAGCWFDATTALGCFSADAFGPVFVAFGLGLAASAVFEELPVLPALDWARAEGLLAFELDFELERAELDLLEFENDDEFDLVRLDDDERFELLPQLLLEP